MLPLFDERSWACKCDRRKLQFPIFSQEATICPLRRTMAGTGKLRDDTRSARHCRRQRSNPSWAAALIVLASTLMHLSPPSSVPTQTSERQGDSSIFSLAFQLPTTLSRTPRLRKSSNGDDITFFGRGTHFSRSNPASTASALESSSSRSARGSGNIKGGGRKKPKSRTRRKSTRSGFVKAVETEEDIAQHHLLESLSSRIYTKDDEDWSELQNKQQAENLRELQRHPALVLNADYQPLRLLPLSMWSWQEAVKSVFSGKVVVVDVYPDISVRAANLVMPVPSVVALREYAPSAQKARPAFTRRNVFLRDGYRCQYCRGLFRTPDLSLDHVEPRCMGGKLTWDNTVTSCRKCNGRKGSLRVSELSSIGMTLSSKPRIPSSYELAMEANKFVPRGKVHPTWAPFLGMCFNPDEEEQAKVNGGSCLRKTARKDQPPF